MSNRLQSRTTIRHPEQNNQKLFNIWPELCVISFGVLFGLFPNRLSTCNRVLPGCLVWSNFNKIEYFCFVFKTLGFSIFFEFPLSNLENSKITKFRISLLIFFFLRFRTNRKKLVAVFFRISTFRIWKIPHFSWIIFEF